MNTTVIICISLTSVFAASCSQVMLKKAALQQHPSKLQAFLNPKVIVAYFIFFLATLVSIFCLRYITLITSGFIECAAYIYILVLDHHFFQERITPRKVLATAFIIAGIALCLFE